MANIFTQMNRVLNKSFKEQLGTCKIQVGMVGSFYFMRITDRDGVMTVKLAHEIMKACAATLDAACNVDDLRPMQGLNWMDDGIVANWRHA